MTPYITVFKERTFNRNIKEDIKKEVEKFNIKNKQDCFKTGQQLGSMMRDVITELSVEYNYSEDMIDRFIQGLRSSV